jgi:hypothetical protein
VIEGRDRKIEGRDREIDGRNRKIEWRDIETEKQRDRADNKNPKQSWVAHLLLSEYWAKIYLALLYLYCKSLSLKQCSKILHLQWQHCQIKEDSRVAKK